jgi:G:T/U-mismatch repair DNA glycosylase
MRLAAVKIVLTPSLPHMTTGTDPAVGECEASLDSTVRNPAANDFARVRHLGSDAETIRFNGQASGKFAPHFAGDVYRATVQSSSSLGHMVLTF